MEKYKNIHVISLSACYNKMFKKLNDIYIDFLPQRTNDKSMNSAGIQLKITENTGPIHKLV